MTSWSSGPGESGPSRSSVSISSAYWSLLSTRTRLVPPLALPLLSCNVAVGVGAAPTRGRRPRLVGALTVSETSRRRKLTRKSACLSSSNRIRLHFPSSPREGRACDAPLAPTAPPPPALSMVLPEAPVREARRPPEAPG